MTGRCCHLLEQRRPPVWESSFNGHLLHVETKTKRGHCYRPQRSCGQGNVFTGVCLSTGGEGVCLSACWDVMPPPDQAYTPPGPGRPPLDQADPPWTRQTPPDQTDPPREADSSIRSTSGRYASYWNAFLLEITFYSFFHENF